MVCHRNWKKKFFLKLMENQDWGNWIKQMMARCTILGFFFFCRWFVIEIGKEFVLKLMENQNWNSFGSRDAINLSRSRMFEYNCCVQKSLVPLTKLPLFPGLHTSNV